MEKERVWLEINLDNLLSNLLVVKKIVKNKKILLAIKADAYGLGACEIAQFLEDKIDMLGVASIEEGIILREKTKIKTPILILSPIPYKTIPYLFEYDLIPNVSDKEFLKELINYAQKNNKKLKIHIEIDTGMGRTGFFIKEFEKIYQIIKNQNFLKIEGIFSHFPVADGDILFSKNQLKEFLTLIKKLNLRKKILHLANSCGLLNIPQSHLDMVRPGLIIYGVIPNGIKNEKIKKLIKPVISLKSKIISLRYFKENMSISYGRTYFTSKPTLIGILSCGYGDGYPYQLSNRGEVLLKGKRTNIVGAICMDLTMIDLNNFSNIKVGDLVTLIGKDGKEEITVNDVAFWANTIPYEIITRLSPRVPRVYFKNNEIWKIKKTIMS
ncbi:MAG: alanine racemase [candidate division WOR-3 bacterium]|nr:alanine racemase [candidate division WOR-3 bacterium]MCX7836345.1 alanine racemase [candidate division WOR-3 bacterium]MDW8113550.1 alanine racemase [candidate division WOR-3 bacterium]